MKQDMVHIDINFHGIYKWGEGWDDETKCKFINAITCKYRLWQYQEIHGSMYLISPYSMIFLYPMDTHATIKYDTQLLEDLRSICEDICSATGGTFNMYVNYSTLEFDDNQLERYA